MSVPRTSGWRLSIQIGTDLISRMPCCSGQKASRSMASVRPMVAAAASASSGTSLVPSRTSTCPRLSAIAKRSLLASWFWYSRAIGSSVAGSRVSTAALSTGRSAIRRAFSPKFSKENLRYSSTSVAASSMPRCSSCSPCRLTARFTM